MIESRPGGGQHWLRKEFPKLHQVLDAAGFEPDFSSDETSTSKDTTYIPKGSRPIGDEGHKFFINRESGWQPHWEHWHDGEVMHSEINDSGNMHPEYEGLEPHEQMLHYFKKIRDTKRLETAAIPKFQKVSGAGSLAKSLSTSAKSSTTKLGGSVPTMKSSGSSFAETLIQQVVAGSDPRKLVALIYEGDRDMERSASVVSPSGSKLRPDEIRPGNHIGIRGPVHNGFHTVDNVANGMVTMKCESGRMVTIPLSDLDDHEVVHALENV